MPYDKRWDRQTKADPFSLEGLIAWLEKQPADKTYNFSNCQGLCLLSQYLTASGKKWGFDYGPLIEKAPAVEPVAMTEPWTFGAALERARKAQS